MHGEIITIGNELISGRATDTNSSHAAKMLTNAGLDVICITSVGDDSNMVSYALHTAMKRSEFAVITGGLGSTDDDITAKIVANALNCQLELNKETLDNIKKKQNKANNKKSAFHRSQYPTTAPIKPVENSFIPGTATRRYVPTPSAAILTISWLASFRVFALAVLIPQFPQVSHEAPDGGEEHWTVGSAVSNTPQKEFYLVPYHHFPLSSWCRSSAFCLAKFSFCCRSASFCSRHDFRDR